MGNTPKPSTTLRFANKAEKVRLLKAMKKDSFGNFTQWVLWRLRIRANEVLGEEPDPADKPKK